MSTASSRVFATTPVQELIAEEFPAWRTGTCILRDRAGKICGTLWFTREGGGGVRVVIGPMSLGGDQSEARAEETRF